MRKASIGILERRRAHQALRRVKCGTHGKLPGYVICRCILEDKAPVRAIERPEDSEVGIGSIVCDRMAPDDHEQDRLVLICEKCAAPYVAQVLQ